MKHPTRGLGTFLITCALAGTALVACDPLAGAPPATATETSLPSLAPSNTVNPVLPTVAENIIAGDPILGTQILDFTPANDQFETPQVAASGSGEPLPLQFVAQDGFRLPARYLSATRQPAPAVLIFPDRNDTFNLWMAIAQRLRDAGFNVLILSQRPPAETRDGDSAIQSVGDGVLVLGRLADLPGVDKGRLYSLGGGLGANIAFAACASTANCRGAVAISPSLKDTNVDLATFITAYQGRPLFASAGRGVAENEQALALLGERLGDSARIVLYEGAARGLDLWFEQPALADAILAWLAG
jgi:hypothetical protein